MPRKLTKLKITEVASVDRGAGDGVRVMLTKRRDPMADAGENILGEFLGVRLKKARDAFLTSVRSILGDESIADKSAVVDKSVDQLFEHVADVSDDIAKTLAGGDPAPSEDDPMTTAALKKALGLPENATDADVLTAVTRITGEETKKKDEEIAKLGNELAIAKLSPIEKQHFDSLSGDPQAAFLKASADERRTIMLAKKEPELPPEIKKALADVEVLKAENAKLVADAKLESFRKKAIENGMAASQGEVLMKAYAGDAGAIDTLVGLVKAVGNQAIEAGLFKEIGSMGDGKTPDTALGELEMKALELKKAQPHLNYDQAFAKVYQDPVNQKLAARERADNRPRAI